MLAVDPHPLLAARAFTTTLPAPMATLTTTIELTGAAPFAPPDDALRAAIRDLLRHGGFKPTGRSKPASEYLIKAAEGGFLSPINPVVDACNLVSLHSGFPISVIDLDRAASGGGPFRIGIAGPEETYIFNASGQVIDIAGLLCLFDDHGPCANAVKDAQRTKTDGTTQRTLSVLWGTRALVERLDAATIWYRGLVESLGATTEPVPAG